MLCAHICKCSFNGLEWTTFSHRKGIKYPFGSNATYDTVRLSYFPILSEYSQFNLQAIVTFPKDEPRMQCVLFLPLLFLVFFALYSHIICPLSFIKWLYGYSCIYFCKIFTLQTLHVFSSCIHFFEIINYIEAKGNRKNVLKEKKLK